MTWPGLPATVVTDNQNRPVRVCLLGGDRDLEPDSGRPRADVGEAERLEKRQVGVLEARQVKRRVGDQDANLMPARAKDGAFCPGQPQPSIAQEVAAWVSGTPRGAALTEEINPVKRAREGAVKKLLALPLHCVDRHSPRSRSPHLQQTIVHCFCGLQIRCCRAQSN